MIHLKPTKLLHWLRGDVQMSQMLIFSICWCPFLGHIFWKDCWDAILWIHFYPNRPAPIAMVFVRLVFLFLLVLSLIEIGQLLKVPEWKTDRLHVQSQKPKNPCQPNSKEWEAPHHQPTEAFDLFHKCVFSPKNLQIFSLVGARHSEVTTWESCKIFLRICRNLSNEKDVKDVAKWYTCIIYYILYNYII